MLIDWKRAVPGLTVEVAQRQPHVSLRESQGDPLVFQLLGKLLQLLRGQILLRTDKRGTDKQGLESRAVQYHSRANRQNDRPLQGLD